MFKNILFPVDIEDKKNAEKSFKQVIEFVGKFDAELTVTTVIQEYGASMVERYFPKGWLKEAKKEIEGELNKLINKHGNGKKINLIIEKGTIYESIIEVSKKIEADLIILTANRPELKEYLLGPNAAKVVRHSEVSVMILRIDC